MSFFNAKTKLLTGAIFLTLFFAGLLNTPGQVLAVWNGTQYKPGTTLDPECTPTQTSCNIVPPVSQSGNQDLSGTLTLTPTTAAGLSLSPYGTAVGNTSELRLFELAANGNNFVAFKSTDSLTGDVVWTLPNADGTTGQVLSTDGSGALSWTSSPTITLIDTNIFVGNGSNAATGVALSGDATIANTGVLTIGNEVVTLAKLATDAVNSAKIVDGSIALADLSGNSVDTTKIIDATITNADVSTTAAIIYSKLSLGNSIVLADLTANSVNSSKIVDGSIVAADLATGAVTSVKILDNTITNADIAASAAITLSKLASGTSGQIIVANASGVPVYVGLSGDATISNAGALTIANLAVTNAKLAADSVTSAKITDGTIAAADLGTSSVTTVKILDANVTLAKLATNSVNSSKIADGSIVNADIGAAAAIALSKLASGTSGQLIVGNASGVPTYAALSGDATISNAGVLTIGANAIDGTNISVPGETSADLLVFNGTDWDDVALSGDATVTNAGVLTIAANAITTGKILDGTILNADIGAAAAIALSKLASGSSIVTSLGAPTGSNANGGSITSNVLTLSLADGTNPGLVSTGAQTIAGAKTFSGLSSFTGAGAGLAVTNNATVGGTLGVTGATTLSSTLAVTGNQTNTADLAVNGNTTLGNATGDTLTINSTAVSTPNNLNIDANTLYVDATNNRIGIGTATPNNTLQVVDLIDFSLTELNSKLGYQAGKNLVSGAQFNTFLGYETGLSSSTASTVAADNNTAVGYASFTNNTTGANNTATGYQSLFSNTEGIDNTAIGFQSLTANTAGTNNTAIGSLSLSVNTSGEINTAVGAQALSGNTTGTNNTAIGTAAGSVITGSSAFNTISSNSLYLGSNTKALADGGDNETVIGYDATGNGSNSVTLGSTAVTKTVLQGNVGIGTTSPTSKLQVLGRVSINDADGLNLSTAGFANGNYGIRLAGVDNNVDGHDLRIRGRNTPSGAFSDLMIVKNSGNVGIGTTTPNSKFHVVGDSTFGGAMTVTGSSTFSGSVDIASARTSGLTMNGNITAESVPTAVTQNIVTADTLTKIIGVTNGTVGQYTSVVLDASGSPVIAYYNGSNSSLNLARCANASCTSWTINEVDNADAVGTFNALVLNIAGNAVISYYDATNFDLKVARCENAACSKATISVVDSTNNVGQYTSIALDASGNPVVSYYDVTGLDLEVVVCGNATCSSGNTFTTVDSTGNVGQFTSLKLDASGNPVISYYYPSGLDLKVVVCGDATCSSVNTFTTVDSAGSVGLYTSLVLDGSGFPIISYYDATNFRLKVAVCGNATCGASNSLVILDSSADVGTITTSIALASGNPVVSYYDATNDNLKLAVCGNAACSSGNTLTVVESLGDVGQYSSVVLNGSGNPIITSFDVTKLDLIINLCSTANCSSSTKKTLDGTYQATGEYAAMKLDASGNAIIAYHEHSLPSAGMLMVKHCADSTCSSATTTVVDSTGGAGQHISMTLDASDNPVISYYESTGGDLKVARCANTDCSSATINIVDSTNITGQYTSIVLDASSNPVISYYDTTAFDLKVAHCADANCASATKTVVDSANVVGQFTSIQLDASGFPIVSYYDVTNLDLKVAHCTDANCTGATLTVVDSDNNVGNYTSMKLNGAGNPVISYFHPTTANLKLAVCANTDCSSATLNFVETSLSNVGGWNSLALDSLGNPVISYADATNGNLKLVHCNDTFCAGNNETINIVDAPGSVGQYTTLALDGSGNPVIAYYDYGNGALKFAHCTDVNCSASTGGFDIGSRTNFFKNVYASDIYAKTMTMNGFDLAEGYMSDDNLTYGELVTVADSQALITGIPDGDAYVARSTTPYQVELIGVVSTAPGVYLSNWQDGKKRYPVALAGRVPTKVTTENGAIKAGDPITASSLAGAGMKATEAGRVVGIALEAYASEDTTAVGTILVFVNPEWYSGNGLAHSTVSSSQLEKLVISGALTIGNLEVLGESIFRNIATFTADANFEKAVVFAGDVTFKGRALFEDRDIAGFAKIAMGQDRVEVIYEKEYAQTPVVQVSLSSVTLTDETYEINVAMGVCSKDEERQVCEEKATKNALFYNRGQAVANSTVKGFTILLESPALHDLTFSWTVIPVQNTKTHVNEVTPTRTPTPSPTPTPIPEASPSPTPPPTEEGVGYDTEPSPTH